MADALKVGDKAPDFSLESDSGKTVTLKSLKGKQVVLYFYPKDDTPGCTTEACDFRDAIKPIEKTNAVVLGVSMDDIASHKKFIQKYSLPFPLLSDKDGKVSKAYDVYKLKNMYGKTYWGIERCTFVIDASGKIKAVVRKVKVDGHTGDVKAALQAE